MHIFLINNINNMKVTKDAIVKNFVSDLLKFYGIFKTQVLPLFKVSITSNDSRWLTMENSLFVK